MHSANIDPLKIPDTMKTTTAPQISNAQALAALAVLTAYTMQATAHTIKAAHRLALGSLQWLTARHDFIKDEDPTERVTLTGWQFLGILAACTAVTFALSIQW